MTNQIPNNKFAQSHIVHHQKHSTKDTPNEGSEALTSKVDKHLVDSHVFKTTPDRNEA